VFVALLAGGLLPAHAEGLDAGSGYLAGARDRALRNYGWRPESLSYISLNTRLVATPGGTASACPSAIACSMPNGTVYVNTIPDDPRLLDYVLNHEFIHAMEYARGSSEGTVGYILADLLVLSRDPSFPLAASAARRVLGLSGADDHPVITGGDWFHIEHDILEDVGWDVANLPGWYRAAYFPYLLPGPDVRKVVTPSSALPPRDTDLRMQRLLDTIVRMCGPVRPGARLSAPSVTCGTRPLWSGVPYPALTGGFAPPPAPPAPPALMAAPAKPAITSVPTVLQPAILEPVAIVANEVDVDEPTEKLVDADDA
jgi:hypothetical protein